MKQTTPRDLTEQLEAERLKNQELLVQNAELQKDRDQFRDIACYDALTQLHSRAYTSEALVKSWAASCYESLQNQHDERRASVSFSRSFAVVMVDIDHFKLVNDQHGHDVGDDMLRAVADVLKVEARDTDVVGRWGGEEFLVVLPETSQVSAEHMAHRLRGAIERAQVGRGVLSKPLTVSVGVSGAGPNNPVATPEAAVKLADEALYRAKQTGRDRVEVSFATSK